MSAFSHSRGPSKRKIKPPAEPVVDIEFGDSTDDSDFNIDDHHEVSDDSFNSDGDMEGSQSESGSSDEEASADERNISNKVSVHDLVKDAGVNVTSKDLSSMLICCVCLGDRSDHVNEIVECDRCGVAVHEGCYGVAESASVASSDSTTPTEPWFCEPCRAGVYEPSCELCPNTGGIFKVTDVGRWVHLVCALYVPGVAFGEVDRLTNVTLFEMPYNKWGSKACGLCVDDRLARCGVQIGCDAGMCKQYFHVTCAQREGLLSEAHSEEVDQADPFYAHCKLHTEKQVMRRRRNNYMLLLGRQAQRWKELEGERASATPCALRIERKLDRKRSKYLALRQSLTQPWVPTQKMPRLLTTSASACRALWRKTELMEIDVLALESKEAKAAALAEVGNKWHIPPAFSVEFTSYFLDRNVRIPIMKTNLQKLIEKNKELAMELETLEKRYSSVVGNKQGCENENSTLRTIIEQYHNVVTKVEPTKRLPIIQDIILHARSGHGSPMMVPTAAALKAGVGYPILRTNYKGQRQTEPRAHIKPEQNGVVTHECGICRRNRDQHLLAKCDVCLLHYHLGCLSPPLTRMPKKTKQMGWQCSECDKDSGTESAPISGPRPSRLRIPSSFLLDSPSPPRKRKPEEDKTTTPSKSKRPSIPPISTPDKPRKSARPSKAGKGGVEKTELPATPQKDDGRRSVSVSPVVVLAKLSEEDLERKERKKKRKKKPRDMLLPGETLPPIKIKIKTILSGDGKSSSTTFMTSSAVEVDPLGDVVIPEPPLPEVQKKSARHQAKKARPSSKDNTECDTCRGAGDKNNLVQCDECMRSYHFGCLDPPLKKSPKVKGYSWHCSECDSSDKDKK